MVTGADSGFFLEGGALVRNSVIDWWQKQIIITKYYKSKYEEEAFDQAII